MIYKNIQINETKGGNFTAIVHDKKVSRKSYSAMQTAINSRITEPGSIRQGKSHKSKLGVFTANVIVAICETLLRRYNAIICINCGFNFGKTIDAWTCDHVTPISYFDANGIKRDHSIGNLAILCRPCNTKKSDKMPTEFYNVETLKLIADIQREANDILTDKNLHVIVSTIAKLFAMQSRKFAKLYRGGMFLRLYHGK